MKLFEIFNPGHVELDKGIAQKTVDAHEDGMRKKLGEGSYGIVYATDDPHTVEKFSKAQEQLHKDGYFVYLMKLLETREAEKNPYFPRVYNVSVDYHTGRYRVEMETLKKYGYDSSRADLFEALYHKMFDDVRYDGDVRDAQDLSGGDWYDAIMNNIWGNYHETWHNIRDPELDAALKFIRALRLPDGSEPDLVDINTNNVMLRYTPAGPQLVITDPIA